MSKTCPLSDSEKIVCDGCGGKLKQHEISDVSFTGSDLILPGTDLVREEVLSNQTLCWVCINDLITHLILG
jgi:hypothetical protein